MEYIPRCSLLEVLPGTLTAVRKEHGLDSPGSMKQAVDELEEWVQEQNHFKKKDFSRHYLETLIISSKGSMERAKCRMERVCVLRSTMPHFFGNYHIRDDFKDCEASMMQTVLPKLTKDHSRIYLAKAIGTKFPSNVVAQGARVMFMLVEYLRAYDYNDGIVLVVDFRDINLISMATKINVFEVRQISTIMMEGYGARLKGIHFMTTSFLINIMVAIFKTVVSAKVGSRIHVHKDLESIHKVLDVDILPEEYGGRERSFEVLYEEWREVLSSPEFREYQRAINSAGVDEAMRQPKQNGGK